MAREAKHSQPHYRSMLKPYFETTWYPSEELYHGFFADNARRPRSRFEPPPNMSAAVTPCAWVKSQVE